MQGLAKAKTAAGLIAAGLTMGAVGVATQEPPNKPPIASVTFTKDVAPILYKSCVECHRPTMFAPMSLMTFEDARPWARAIRQRVTARTMPPWGADPAHGTFKNDPRLADRDIE